MSPNIDNELLHPVVYSGGRPLITSRVKKPMVEHVYDFIVSYKKSHDGNSPTIREIGEACGISSTSVVSYWLHRLESRGLIRRPEPTIGNRFATKIEVVGGKWYQPHEADGALEKR
jgi:SOS-response transcriptional repressor LexA